MATNYVARVVANMPGQLDPRYKDMADRSRLVLVVMASRALDKDGTKAPAGHYFAGWHVLANALGFPNANTGTAGHRAVARAIRDLRNRGLVVPVGPMEERLPTARHVYFLDV